MSHTSKMRILVVASLLLAGSCDAEPHTGGSGATRPCYAEGIDYPATLCGYDVGQVIPNFSFQGRMAGIDSPVTIVHLADFYDPRGERGLRFLLINATTLWCPYCKPELTRLPSMNADYGPRGVRFLTLLLERLDGSSAAQDDVDALIRTYSLTTTVTNDPEEVTTLFFDKSSMPLNLLVDLRTMKIVRKIVGAGAETVRATLDGALGGG